MAGCVIARTIKPKADGTVTYSKHVAPILQKNCQECHRPGQIGPMSLLTYDDALAWAETIREVVQEGRMPPWHADPKLGHFSNDRSLSKEDRDTLLAWIEQGCPRGRPARPAAAAPFPQGWSIGKPDVVLSMPKPFNVPAKGGKNGIRYQYFPVADELRGRPLDSGRRGESRATAPLCITSSSTSCKPGERYATAQHRRHRQQLAGGLRARRSAAVFAPGTAKKIPKGSTLLFQMHYTPNGIEQKDRSSVGLIFAKKPPKHECARAPSRRRVSAFRPARTITRSSPPPRSGEDVQLLSLFPHMHLRGKDFEYRVVYPDGKSEDAAAVPRYDFNWQSHYRLAKPLHLPAGTRIECTAHFDNSADNPNNPDPKKTVRWGEQTWEEMMIGFVDYVFAAKAKE